MSDRRRFITGLSGHVLTGDERAFLKDARPAGVILFRRNAQTADQVQRLTSDVRDALGDEVLILVDEEGGRVQRLRPPVGRLLPSAARYGTCLRSRGPAEALRVTRLVAQLTASDLKELGINANCAPVLDLRFEGAHDIVGDRAYGATADEIVPLATQVAHGFMAGGVLPILKHIPGHGRARCDSHHALPVVDVGQAMLDETDFQPFKRMRHFPAAMTAHVVYTAIDAAAPATVSKLVIEEVIRTQIGFGGLLMTDDLSMKALSGSLKDRAAGAIAAGCDLVLHCNGNLKEMQSVAAEAPPVDGDSAHRLETALSITRLTNLGFPHQEAEAVLQELLQGEDASDDPTEPGSRSVS